MNAERPPTSALRILIAVGVRLYRDGIATVLHGEPRVQIVGAVRSAGEAWPAIVSVQPDVVLLDMSMPGARSLAQSISKTCGPPHTVALGIDETEAAIISSAEVGVEAFVSADDSVSDLIAVADAATRGELVCSPRVAVILRRRVAASGPQRDVRESPKRLTAREHDVALLLDEGLSNREIAERLSIEVSTVKNHVHSVFDKLGVNRRCDVALRAESVPRSAWSSAENVGEIAPKAAIRQIQGAQSRPSRGRSVGERSGARVGRT